MPLERRLAKNSHYPFPIHRTSSRSLGPNNHFIFGCYRVRIDHPGNSDFCSHIRGFKHASGFDRLQLCHRSFRFRANLWKIGRSLRRKIGPWLWPIDGLSLYLDGWSGAELRPTSLLPLSRWAGIINVFGLRRSADLASRQ